MPVAEAAAAVEAEARPAEPDLPLPDSESAESAMAKRARVQQLSLADAEEARGQLLLAWRQWAKPRRRGEKLRMPRGCEDWGTTR